MQNPIDRFINNVTMYRLLVLGLLAQLFTGAVAAQFDVFSFQPFELLISVLVLLVACYGASAILSRSFQQATGSDSAIITALILACIITPQDTAIGVAAVGATGLLAILSKYVFAYKGRQIFNPVAAGAFLALVLNLTSSGWWVANMYVLPVTLIVGVLIIRKIHRLQMVASFVAVATVGLLWLGYADGRPMLEVLIEILTSYPVFFLGTVMLTEPTNTPPEGVDQNIYGALVGGLFATRLSLFGFSMSPNVALLIGNIYSFIVSPKQRPKLWFKERIQLSPTSYDFIFETDEPVKYQAGQYVELTLPGTSLDAKGNRRYFTIASSPEEGILRFGVKIPQKPSAFKQRLMELQPGDLAGSGSVSGHFVLPSDHSEKIVMFAGGVGITPFRSMIKHVLEAGEKRDIVLFQVVSDPKETIYEDVLGAAIPKGIKTVQVLHGPGEVPADWKGEVGVVTPEMLAKYVPDIRERTAYLSGPTPFVSAYRKLLLGQGVRAGKVKTDYFTGY